MDTTGKNLGGGRRACTVRVDAGEGERVRACGFEPAKALVRGLLLPQLLPFQLRLGYQLPPLRPIRGVGARARPLIWWLQMGGVLVGGWGSLPAQCWDLNTCRGVLTHEYFDQEDPFGISAGIYSLPYGLILNPWCRLSAIRKGSDKRHRQAGQEKKPASFTSTMQNERAANMSNVSRICLFLAASCNDRQSCTSQNTNDILTK